MNTLFDVLPFAAFVAGWAAVVAGAAQIFAPAGWIVAGLVVAVSAAVAELR